MATAYVALGGNLGPVAETFHQAIDDLNSHPGISVCQVSRSFQTKSVGPDAGPSFLNATIGLETDRAPLDLLDALQSVERRRGRVCHGHWTPRTLDLDLILYDNLIIQTRRLHVPHPACWYRRFVLDPLCDIAADVEHPTKKCTMRRLRERLLRRPFRCTFFGVPDRTSTTWFARLRQDFPDVVFSWHDRGTIPDENATTLLIGLVPVVGLRATDGGQRIAPSGHLGWLDLSDDVATAPTVVHTTLEAALGKSRPLS